MAETDSFSARSAAGAKWLSMARFVRILVTIATLAFLARKLDAATFGLMALGITMAMFAAILADLGIRQALIRKAELRDDEIASALWLNIAIGAICSGLIWAFADQIGTLIDDSRATWLLRAMAPIFVIGALMGVPGALLERNMRFKAVAMTELGAALIGSAAVVIAVAFNADLGGLVIQQYVTLGLTALGLWVLAGFVPRSGFSWSAVRPLLSFGLYISLAELVRFGGDNLERPVVASAISAEALGPLAIARQIIYGPLQTITQAVSRVVYPALASIISDQNRLRDAQIQGMHFVMFLVAPVCTGLIAVSTPMVAVLLGPGWETVPLLMSLYALQAMMIGLVTFNDPLIKALGRSGIFFLLELATAIAMVAVLFLSLPYGVVGIVIGRVIVTTCTALVRCFVGCRLIQQSFVSLLVAAMRPMANATLMMLALFALQWQLDLTDWVVLGLCIPLGAAIYMGLAFMFDRPVMLRVANLLLTKKRKPVATFETDSNGP